MERWGGRVAIVTGASSGSGAVLLEALVKHGMKVVGCSRNIEAIQNKVKELEGESGTAKAFKCDVTKEDDVMSLIEFTRSTFGKLDVLINNAGLGHAAPLLTGQTAEWRDMMEVNVLGVAVCTREAVKCMRECGVDDGHIINVSSEYGQTLPHRGVVNFYAITKVALNALTASTRSEVRELNSHIKVSQVSPKMFATEFVQRFRKTSAEEAQKVYDARPHMNASDVVDTILYILAAPSHLQIDDMVYGHVEEL